MPTEPAAGRHRGATLWVGILVLYVVWGSTYLGIAVAVETIPPFLMAAIRFASPVASCSCGRSRATAGPFVPPTRREWRDSLIVGALLLGGGMGMVALGRADHPVGHRGPAHRHDARLGRGLRPAVPRRAPAAHRRRRDRRRLRRGRDPRRSVRRGRNGRAGPAGLVAVLLSPICWSLGSLFASHRAVLPRQPLVATGAQMLAGAGVLTLHGRAPGRVRRRSTSRRSRRSRGRRSCTSRSIGSLLAFTTYGWLLRVAPLPLIATYAYVNPVVAVILGAIVLDEPIEPRTLVAGGIIVVAVALIVTARGRMQAPRQIPAPDVAPIVASPASSG